MDNLESKVVDAILERTTDKITIDNVEYPVGPPTAGTLILISELVADFPEVNEKPQNVYTEVLRIARDASALGRIVATLILGAKRIKEERKISVTVAVESWRRWSWRKFRMVSECKEITEFQSEIDYISARLVDEVSSNTLLKIVAKQLGMMQVADFFELSTFLSGANRLKATREVETASGAK